MIEFKEFPKIARLNRACTITEKIDGTNAQIFILDTLEPFTLDSGRVVPFMVGSRNRWIFPESDNAGFARWAYENAEELLKLGPGQHFGEWWGAGIQRRYGLGASGEKRFSLFNTARWKDKLPTSLVSIVPVLYEGQFSTGIVDEIVERLRKEGSVASPGFMTPEGVVIYLHASRTMYKVTCEKDSEHKGNAQAS